MVKRDDEDEKDDFDHALEVAEDGAGFAELLTRPGMPHETAAALYEPLDLDDLTPPTPEPHHQELICGWVGRKQLGRSLDDACRILGHMRLWWALGFLEPLDTPAPIASLAADIDARRITLETLAKIYKQTTDDHVIAYGSPDTPTIELKLRDALAAIYSVVQAGLQNMEGIRQSRTSEAEHVRASATGQRGARGVYSGPARMRRFLEGAAPLVAAGWNRSLLAELIVDSRTWTKPPCRRYVDEVLDRCAGDRKRAVACLAGRINDAERRS